MPSSKLGTRLRPKRSTMDKPVVFTFDAIGTQWTIEIFQELSATRRTKIVTSTTDRIAAFDANYSRFRSDSLVARMAQKAGTYTLPSDARAMLDLYKKLYDITEGKVTPLIGDLLEDAGYDAQYSLQPKAIRGVPKWNEILEYDFPKLTVRRPTMLDFGAAGKGYLVDIIGELLHTQKVYAFSINAGGDILVSQPPTGTLPIALEHPADASMAIGIAKLSHGSLCGSSGNRRAWADYHHIMDPDKQASPMHIHALWVYAETAILADAISTCLFFASPELIARYFDFEYAIVKTDNSLVVSPKFPATFFGKDTENQ